ncbi:MAG: hypothetical protein FJ100_06675 [Deltaproteobacteria bacterium]|nr:hypothetical protein [Deltaproteobacteria bacterium]
MPPPEAASAPAPAAPAPAGPGAVPAPREPAAQGPDAAAGTATAPQPLTEGAALSSILAKDQALGDIAQPLATKLATASKTQADFDGLYADVGVLRHDAIAAFLDVGQPRPATQTVGAPDPIAVQKFADIDGEAHLSDPGLKDSFYLNLVTEMKKPSFTDRTRTYNAMKAAAPPAQFSFKGNPITPDRITPYSSRNQSVDKVYDINTIAPEIDAAIETPLAAARARPDTIAAKKADRATRLKAYRHIIASRDPLTTLDKSKPISPYAAWYKPGEITVPPGSNETQFASMMQLGALQPEWYPNGTVVLNIQRTLEAGARDIRKPTAFDGLMSVLWVSRNVGENDYGVTDGGIGEFLEKGVTYNEVVSAQAVIPSDDFLADIQRVASQVNNAVPGSSPTEELARGNNADTSILHTAPEARGMYNDILSTTANERQNPSPAPTVPGAARETSAAMPNARSRHAVGNAPGGWQSQVVATVPSENVRRDDPGHTYHILANGQAVATSEPTTLAPEVAQQLQRQVPVAQSNQNVQTQQGRTDDRGANAAPGQFNANAVNPASHEAESRMAPGQMAPGQTALTTNAANPAFEREALDFERNLGSKAAIDGVPHAAAIMARVRAYFDARVSLTAGGDAATAQAALQGLYQKCMTTRNNFAGAVPNTVAAMEAVMASALQIQANLANFDAARQVAAQAAGAATIREMMTFIYNFGAEILNGEHVKAQDASARAQLQQVAQAANLNLPLLDRIQADSMWLVQRDNPGQVQLPQGAPAIAGQSADVLNGQAQTRGVAQPIHNRINGTPDGAGCDMSARPVGSLDAQVQPGPRERERMGLQPGDRDTLIAWSEGTKRLMINELDPWVVAMRAMSLPLAGGPSGTTNMLMNVNDVVQGVGSNEARLACIGYLLPIHAHTLVEVMTSAATHGAGYTAGQQMYRNIAPYTEESLREACGLTPAKPDGKKRFPDEAAPTPAGAATAQAGTT